MSEEFDPFWPVKQVIQERDDAQEAAANYHEAWQDSAVYWKDKVARLEAQLAERIDMCGELSEAHTKVQVKWGADVDRVNILLDGMIGLMEELPTDSAVRAELEYLVNRVEADLKRNPRDKDG